ncbi:MAG: hypothetical protein IJV73_00965 [Clostridia bacterium]|nr:hypothetical protein [Clostridia bacterium]
MLTSVLTIALCIGIIVGSTYALFGDETRVNVMVSAANLDVTASIENGKLLTHSAGDAAEFSREGSFANGGMAVIDPDNSSNILISSMTPGDKIRFNVDVENNSDIAIRYRIVWASNVSETEVDLADALNVTVQVNGEDELNMTDRASDYYNVSANGEITTFTVTIEFPDREDNNSFRGAQGSLSFVVEAVQQHGA